MDLDLPWLFCGNTVMLTNTTLSPRSRDVVHTKSYRAALKG